MASSQTTGASYSRVGEWVSIERHHIVPRLLDLVDPDRRDVGDAMLDARRSANARSDSAGSADSADSAHPTHSVHSGLDVPPCSRADTNASSATEETLGSVSGLGSGSSAEPAAFSESSEGWCPSTDGMCATDGSCSKETLVSPRSVCGPPTPINAFIRATILLWA